MAINPVDPLNIVAASMDQGYDEAGVRRSWPLAHVTLDGGATWTTNRPPLGASAGPDHSLSQFNHADDPMVLFLPDGTLLYTALVFQFLSAQGRTLSMTAPSIAVWRSHDGGISFPESYVAKAGSGRRPVSGATGYLEHDKQWLAVGDDGAVVMAWNRNHEDTASCTGTCTDVQVASSSDAGRTWVPSVTVYQGVASGAFPIILDNGTWIVSYRETDDAAIHVAVSEDYGSTWHTNASIDSTTKFPVLAKSIRPDGSGQRVYMAYPMTGETMGQPDVPQTVAIRWSDDGGRTWSQRVVLEESRANGRTSPALAVVLGHAIVTYWLPDDNGAKLVARAVSPVGKVSEAFVLDSHEGPTRTTGDYMGLAPLPDRSTAFAVWNARHGSQHAISGARLTLTAS